MLTPRQALSYYATHPVKVVVAGHVDDGKSTLIGRLLYETHSLPEGKLEELQSICKKRNMNLEWSFVLDAFQAERDQAVTIDSTQVHLKTPAQDYIFVDAPGHIEFLQNMVSAAASADAALLLIDAEQGIRQQTQRHAYLLKFLGIEQVIVLINKMDKVNYSELHFTKLKQEVILYFKKIAVTLQAVIPIAAHLGKGLIAPSKELHWYRGATVLDAMFKLKRTDQDPQNALRFPIQDVYKHPDARILVGRIASGRLQLGDKILLSPSNQTAHVTAIKVPAASPACSASAGESIGITLDAPLFVERGDVMSHVENAPFICNSFRATLFTLGKMDLVTGKTYKMKVGLRETNVIIAHINWLVDVTSLQQHSTQKIAPHHAAQVLLKTHDPIPVDDYAHFRKTARFVLIDERKIIAGGMISLEDAINLRPTFKPDLLHLTKVDHFVSQQEREIRSGHKGGVLWFTGLSGAGKSTLAMGVEQLLFAQNYQVYVLDGDNIRSGLNANLSFSPKDRAENIRRIGEVAALFADAGFICITAFISPYREDREKVRQMVPRDYFHEVYIKADLVSCEKRDPKGLYQKARAGKITQFTGISAPYEAPASPELVVDTVNTSIEAAVKLIAEYVKTKFKRTS